MLLVDVRKPKKRVILIQKIEIWGKVLNVKFSRGLVLVNKAVH